MRVENSVMTFRFNLFAMDLDVFTGFTSHPYHVGGLVSISEFQYY